ncbi:hypothetical protein ACTJLD_35350 [Burkholderia sp. 22088]|uniref:hypothetical protein n=1 Tax=Burkholderia sp. 22088 TaxID=3453871 RepID=UPI003F847EF5
MTFMPFGSKGRAVGARVRRREVLSMLDIKIDDLLIVNNMQTTESKTTERQEGWPPVIRRVPRRHCQGV